MKAADIRKKTDAELEAMLQKQRQARVEDMIEYKTKDVKNVKSLQAHKQTIARVLSVMRERALAVKEDG